MASVYDDLMFHGATYADLSKNGPPLIWISATDISYGTVFTFNQDTFDLLCTDLGSFPVARAVAASNAFPVLFSPITIRDHVDRCGGWRPSWISQDVETDEDTVLRRRFLAQIADAYLDPSRTRYVHLVDGGIADNLALRGLLNEMIQFEYDPEYLRGLGLASVRRILIIVADGEAAQDTRPAKEQALGGLGRIVQAVMGIETDRYNFETMSLARLKLAEMVGHLKRLRCQISGTIEDHACNDVAGYLVHLSLAGIEDTPTRQRLEQIPTGMTIDDADVDALVNAGEEQVKKSSTIAKVVRSIGVF